MAYYNLGYMRAVPAGAPRAGQMYNAVETPWPAVETITSDAACYLERVRPFGYDPDYFARPRFHYQLHGQFWGLPWGCVTPPQPAPPPPTVQAAPPPVPAQLPSSAQYFFSAPTQPVAAPVATPALAVVSPSLPQGPSPFGPSVPREVKYLPFTAETEGELPVTAKGVAQIPPWLLLAVIGGGVFFFARRGKKAQRRRKR